MRHLLKSLIILLLLTVPCAAQLDSVVNFAKVQVRTGYTSTATTILLSAGQGSRLPLASYNMVWWNWSRYSDPSDQHAAYLAGAANEDAEIVRVSSRSGDTLHVIRAQEGTPATKHNMAGATYKMILSATAKTFQDINLALLAGGGGGGGSIGRIIGGDGSIAVTNEYGPTVSLTVPEYGITHDKLANGVVDSNKAGEKALSGSNLADSTITPAKLSPGSKVPSSAFADYATAAGSATSATNASYATTAGSASTAGTATSATYALSAGTAGSATTATSALSATYATTSGSATHSTSADSSGKSLTAATATNATHATTADNATTATNATMANYATTAGSATTVPDGAITAAKIYSGSVVKTINGLTDFITVVGKKGCTITTSATGDTLYISAPDTITGGGGGIAGIQNTDGTITVTNGNGPTTTIAIALNKFDSTYFKSQSIPGSRITLATLTRSLLAAGFKSYYADTADYAKVVVYPSASGDISGTYPTLTIGTGAVTSAKILDGTILRADVSANFKAPYADTADYAKVAGYIDTTIWSTKWNVRKVVNDTLIARWLLLRPGAFLSDTSKFMTLHGTADTSAKSGTAAVANSVAALSVTSAGLAAGSVTTAKFDAAAKAPYSGKADSLSDNTQKRVDTLNALKITLYLGADSCIVIQRVVNGDTTLTITNIKLSQLLKMSDSTIFATVSAASNANNLSSGTLNAARLPATVIQQSDSTAKYATPTSAGNASNLAAGTLPAARLPNSGVTANTYNSANITVDAYGRVTAASSGGSGSSSDTMYDASFSGTNTGVWVHLTGVKPNDRFIAVARPAWGATITNIPVIVADSASFDSVHFTRTIGTLSALPFSFHWKAMYFAGVPQGFNSIAPSNAATGVAVSGTLSWHKSTNATSYDVYLGTVSPGTLMSSSQSDTTYTYSGLTNNTLYYWKVTAKQGAYTADGTGSPWTFTTIVAAPGAFTLTSPTNGATDQAVSGTLSWATSTNAATYDVYLDGNSPPITKVSSAQAGTSYNYSGLNNSATYYWKVVATNAAGSTNCISNFSFGTIAGSAPFDPATLTGIQFEGVSDSGTGMTGHLTAARAGTPDSVVYWYDLSGKNHHFVAYRAAGTRGVIFDTISLASVATGHTWLKFGRGSTGTGYATDQQWLDCDSAAYNFQDDANHVGKDFEIWWRVWDTINSSLGYASSIVGLRGTGNQHMVYQMEQSQVNPWMSQGYVVPDGGVTGPDTTVTLTVNPDSGRHVIAHIFCYSFKGSDSTYAVKCDSVQIASGILHIATTRTLANSYRSSFNKWHLAADITSGGSSTNWLRGYLRGVLIYSVKYLGTSDEPNIYTWCKQKWN